MNQALDYGLITAVLYGVSDFVAKFSSRSVGVLRTLFWGQSCSALMLTAWIGLAHAAPSGLSALPWSVWGVAILTDATILSATALFYRALTLGRFAVVMPIIACYGAIAALLSAVFGEPLGLFALGGIGIAVFGGAVACIPPRAGAMPPPPLAAGNKKGAILAAIAAGLYGIGFFAQARFSVPELGPLVPVWLYYLLGATLVGIIATVTRRDLSLPRSREWPAVLGSGLAASTAFVMLAIAVAGGDVAVPTVLASLASVVTVVLARFLVKEQVAMHQWVGIVAVILGLAILQGSAHIGILFKQA